MTGFERAEAKGRRIVEKLIKGKCIRYEFQPTNSKIDLFATGYSHTAAIEIKDRERYTAEQVESFGGMYIKETKYNSLMYAAVEGYTPYFFVVYSDYIYVWDLTDMELEFHMEYMDKTCVEDNGKDWYSVSYLHLKDAIARYETKRYE